MKIQLVCQMDNNDLRDRRFIERLTVAVNYMIGQMDDDKTASVARLIDLPFSANHMTAAINALIDGAQYFGDCADYQKSDLAHSSDAPANEPDELVIRSLVSRQHFLSTVAQELGNGLKDVIRYQNVMASMDANIAILSNFLQAISGIQAELTGQSANAPADPEERNQRATYALSALTREINDHIARIRLEPTAPDSEVNDPGQPTT